MISNTTCQLSMYNLTLLRILLQRTFMSLKSQKIYLVRIIVSIVIKVLGF